MACRFDTLLPSRVLLCALFLAPAFDAQGDAPMRILQIKVGPHSLKVEVAQSDPERAKGLMFRRSMGANDGMLFIFSEPAYHSMWMKNTLIPLSVAFVDSEGVILNILDMEPQTLDTHMSAGPSVYAVETNKGWFAQKKIKAGDRVTGLPGGQTLFKREK